MSLIVDLRALQYEALYEEQNAVTKNWELAICNNSF
jgi:hypothetical protein